MSKRSVPSFKVVIIGDGGVGKTSIIQRYLGYGFRPQYLKTIGANFYHKVMEYKDLKLGDLEVQLIVWDLAGQPRFNEVRSAYYKGARGAAIVFDITKEESFKNVPGWIQEFWNNVGIKPFVLVGNKKDLRGEAKTVPEKEVKELLLHYSQKLGVEIPYIESSAKTGENIEKIFKSLVEIVLDFMIKILKKRSN